MNAIHLNDYNIINNSVKMKMKKEKKGEKKEYNTTILMCITFIDLVVYITSV